MGKQVNILLGKGKTNSGLIKGFLDLFNKMCVKGQLILNLYKWPGYDLNTAIG